MNRILRVALILGLLAVFGAALLGGGFVAGYAIARGGLALPGLAADGEDEPHRSRDEEDPEEDHEDRAEEAPSAPAHATEHHFAYLQRSFAHPDHPVAPCGPDASPVKDR